MFSQTHAENFYLEEQKKVPSPFDPELIESSYYIIHLNYATEYLICTQTKTHAREHIVGSGLGKKTHTHTGTFAQTDTHIHAHIHTHTLTLFLHLLS